MQGQGVGLAADVARDHRDRAEFSHRAGVAQQDSIEHPPAHVRQRYDAEYAPAAGAHRERGFLIIAPLRLHERDQLPRDEGESDESRGEHHARHREDDLEIVIAQPVAEPAAGAEHQHKNQTGDDRRHREGQVDERQEKPLGAKFKLADRPGRRDAKDGIQRHGNRCHGEGHAHGGQRVSVGQCLPVGDRAVGEGLHEDGHQRQQQEQRQVQHRDAHQQDPSDDAGRAGAAGEILALSHRFPRWRRCSANCPALTTNIMAKDSSSMATATTAASRYWNCSSLVMITSGTISETCGMLPAMKITEPYSPRAREKARALPVISAGSRAGKMTRRKTSSGPAPSVSAARSRSWSRSAITGCRVRTTKGRLIKLSATMTPRGVKATWIPKGTRIRPSQPLGAYSVWRAMP